MEKKEGKEMRSSKENERKEKGRIKGNKIIKEEMEDRNRKRKKKNNQ